MKNILLFSFMAFAIQSASAQQSMANISGSVVSEDGTFMTDTYIYLKNTAYYAEVNPQGKFRLQVPAANYNLICSMGFVKEFIAISLQENADLVHDFILIPDKKMILEEVRLQGKSKI